MDKTTDAVNQLGDIAKSTNNDAIILAIVIILGLVAVAIPLYILYTKRDKAKLQQYIQREDRILQVVENNAKSNITIAESNTKVAEAIAGLRTAFDGNTRNCDLCKAEQMSVMSTIMNKQDTANLLLTKIETRVMAVKEDGKV
jgi:hypothetical protein